MRGLTQRGFPVHFKLEDAWATKYVGAPYVPGGRTIKGFDCWGLIHLIWSNEFGTELDYFDGVAYHDPSSCKELQKAAEDVVSRATKTNWSEVPIENADKGTVLTVSLRGHLMHCAAVIRPGIMLQALENVGCHAVDYTSPLWNRRVLKGYKYAA